MKLSKRILSWLSVLAMVATLFSGVIAVSADEIDFDALDKVVYDDLNRDTLDNSIYGTNPGVFTQAEGDNAIKVTTNGEIGWAASNPYGEKLDRDWTGWAFNVKTNGAVNITPYLYCYSGAGGVDTMYAANGAVTLVDMNGAAVMTNANSGVIALSEAFEGWIIIDKDILFDAWGKGTSAANFTAKTMAHLLIGIAGVDAGEEVIIDDLYWLAPAIAECEHDWVEATCSAPKTCSLCGETEGEALGHSYVDGKCSACGAWNLLALDKVNAQAVAGSTSLDFNWDNGGATGTVALDASAVTSGWYGFAFYLSIPTDGGVQPATDFIPHLRDGSGMYWGAANGITLVAADGTVTELAPTAAYTGYYTGCRYTIPDDFEGWVYVAKSSLAQYWNGAAYMDENALASTFPNLGIEFWGWINTGVVSDVSWLIVEGETCEHEWVDATCTDAQYCPLCGATGDAALGHNYVNYVCANCGKTDLLPLDKVTVEDFEGTVETNGTIVEDGSDMSMTPHFPWNGSAYATVPLKPVALATAWKGFAFYVSIGSVEAQPTTDFTPYLLDAEGNMWCAADEITLVATDGTVTVVKPGSAYNGSYGGCRYVIPGTFEGWMLIDKASLAKFYGGYEYLSADASAASFTTFGIEMYNWVNTAKFDDLSFLVVPACEEHTWEDATCTDPKTCSVCGATEGEALGHTYVDGVCSVCWDDQRIYLTENTNTLTIGAGETKYYASYNGGTTATIMGGGLTVSHNGQDYQLAGVVSFDFVANMMMRQPGVIKVVNNTPMEMTFTVTFTYPVGSMNNPQVITENGDYTAENIADYYYTFTAPADGTVTVTMLEGTWQYVVNNMTSYIYGDQHWNDDVPAVPSETIEVLEGDEISIMVAHYDGRATETGTVKWNFTFADEAAAIGTLVSTQKYDDRLTFEVYEMADGSHKLVVSGTGVMPTVKQAAGFEFLGYKDTVKTVVIGEGVTSVGYGIFNGWTALASVELSGTITTIDGESFRGCTALKAITIPDSVTTLGYMAFSASGLESIVIPASVTDIKNYVFYRCKSLTSAEIYGSTAYKVGSKTYRATGARMFSECSKLENIVLGDVITLLNTYTFHGAALTEFTVPARVKFIYDAAFHSNTKMTKFVMEEGVTYLGWAALFGCSSLTDVTIPETITSGNIATWAFGACTSLESIELPSKLTSLKKRTFSGCTALKSIELPAGVTTLGDRVFIGCTALESVKLSNITKIDVQTFNNCPKLTSITIPETVTSIGDLAFRLNSSLKTVYIDSATIAAGLTGNAVYGNMIKWAETIAIRADIENVPSYVTSNYKTVGTETIDGVEYVTYSK